MAMEDCKTHRNSLNKTFKRVWFCSGILSRLDAQDKHQQDIHSRPKQTNKDFTGNFRKSELWQMFSAMFYQHKTLLKVLVQLQLIQLNTL